MESHKVICVCVFILMALPLGAKAITPAETKRIEILESEKSAEEMALVVEQAGYLNEKDKLAAFRRIETHKRNIELLSAEILASGKMPEISEGQLLQRGKTAEKIIPKKSEIVRIVKKPTNKYLVGKGVGEKEGEVIQPRTKESQSWDVFNEL